MGVNCFQICVSYSSFLSQGGPVNCNSLTWLQFCSMIVGTPMPSWPKYYMLRLNSFFVIHIFILQFLHYELISFTRVLHVIWSSTAQLVACYSLVQETWVKFSLTLSFSFKHHVYNGFGGYYVYFISLVFTLFFISFFVHSHLRTRGAQLVSQRETLLAAAHLMLLCNSIPCSKNV
jgi:hypothetical protein